MNDREATEWDDERPARPASTTRADVIVVADGQTHRRSDQLVTEEPLEIRVLVAGVQHTTTITMRTPGADFELTAGFLHGEQIIQYAADLRRMSYCIDPSLDAAQRYNIVNAELSPGVT